MSLTLPPRLNLALHGALGTLALDLRLETALTGVSLITGPSGAGKTTLLRCIAGLTRLEGEVTVTDVVWQDRSRFVPPHRREVGYVFQDARLFPHLSVRRNLNFGAQRTGPGGHGHPTLDEMAERLKIAPLLDRSTHDLSGGERQRVAIGRALLSQPKLVLMDEPTASLDAAARRDVIALISQLARDLAIPVLLVSHDPGTVAHLASRRIHLEAGRIVENTATGGGDPDPVAGLSPAERDALARAAVLAGLAPLPAGT